MNTVCLQFRKIRFYCFVFTVVQLQFLQLFLLVLSLQLCNFSFYSYSCWLIKKIPAVRTSEFIERTLSFSRMAMNFREHTYEFQGGADFSSSVSPSVQISVQLVGSHLRSVGQRRQHSYQLLLEQHLQTHSVG